MWRNQFPKMGLLIVLSLLMLACGSDSNLIADAGQDNHVAVGAAPEFDGCGSEGQIINYAWEIVGAPTTNQQDVGKMIRATDSRCSFTLEADMQLDEVGKWVIELTVMDDDGNSDTDRVVVTVVN